MLPVAFNCTIIYTYSQKARFSYLYLQLYPITYTINSFPLLKLHQT